MRPYPSIATLVCAQLFLAMFPEEAGGSTRPAGSSRVHFEGSQDFDKRAQQSAALERLDYLEQYAPPTFRAFVLLQLGQEVGGAVGQG
jgi:hypothetical protein